MPNDKLDTNTQKALQRFLSNPHDQDLILIIGGGNCNLITGIKTYLNPQQTLMILDPTRLQSDQPANEPGLYYCYGSRFDNFAETSSRILDNYFLPRFQVIIAPNTDAPQEKYYQQVAQAASAEIRKQTGRQRFKSFIAHIDTRHFILNMPMLSLQAGITKLKNIAPSASAIVVGAGPSLASNMPWLIENHRKFLVIAAGSTANAFSKHGIEPDLYVEIDIRSSDHWQAGHIYNAPLALTPYVTAGLSAQFPNSYWLNNINQYPWQNSLLTQLNNDIESLPLSENTGSATAAVAAYLGAKRVILIGIDLCLSSAGSTHSTLHTHGKDTLCQETEKKTASVMNNKGEKCRTIFQGFIKGFEETFSSFPDIEFIQTSEDGVCFKNAKFQLLNDISIPQDEPPRLPAPVFPEYDLPSFKQLCKKILSSINKFSSFEELELSHTSTDKAAQHLYTLTKISALCKASRLKISHKWREIAECEYPINKSSLKKDIRKAMTIATFIHSKQSTMDSNFFNNLHKLYLQEYPVISAATNLEFELELLKSIDSGLYQKLTDYYSQYPTENPNSIYKAAWQRINMAQLRLKDADGNFRSTIGFYDLVNHSQSVLLEFYSKLYMERQIPAAIICAGIFDGNFLEIINDKLDDFKIIIVEPDFNLFAEILRYCPIISLMNNNASYIIGHDSQSQNKELKARLKPQCYYPVFSADKAGKHLSYYKALYNTLSDISASLHTS